MALALGLLAAFLWGLADFLIRLSGRTVGVHRSMLYSQGFGAVSIGAWILGSGATRGILLEAPPKVWAVALVAALVGFGGTLALYRGLRVGRMGLVAPIAGAYGAVSALLSLADGEPIRPTALVGIAIVVAGAVLTAARRSGGAEEPAGRRRPALLWAGAACLSFGLQFWAQGRYAVPVLGPIIPVGTYYVVATIILAAAAAVRRPPLALSRPSAAKVFGTGLVAVAGFVALSLGLATGHVAVVSALSSLQSSISVGLACLFLGERLGRVQRLGAGLTVLGLVLVRIG